MFNLTYHFVAKQLIHTQDQLPAASSGYWVEITIFYYDPSGGF